MANYRIEPKERLPNAIRRIVLEQIDDASEGLRTRRPDLHEALHEARKSFKKIRAVIRLVRSEIGDACGAENTFYRDLGRELSAARDAQAMTECWDKLKKRFRRSFAKGHFAVAEGVLRDRRNAVEADDSALSSRVAEVLTKLAAARERVPRWTLERDDFAAIEQGFRRVYSQGRRRFHDAFANPTAENFHEWRKRVKDHWYHVRLLEKLWPEVIRGRRDALTRLSQDLGDHHDLIVLHQTIESDPRRFGDDDTVTSLQTLIDRRRQSLECETRQLGAKLYAEGPRRIAERFLQYWEAERR